MTDILHQLCSIPTAPFVEDRVVAFIKQWVKQRKRLTLARDRHGNLLITTKTTSKAPRTILVAHMDHPGFVADSMVDARTLETRFHGYVKPEFFKGTKVRFFDGDTEITGTVTGVRAESNGRPAGATIRVSKPVPTGTIGMWDVGGPRVRGNKFHCRVCDDLAGCASALAAIDLLLKKKSKAPFGLLLTRAEEEAFIGAIAAVKNKQLLKKTDRVISIETSAEQPYAKQGDGVTLRVGDRTSIFHSAYTSFLNQQAEQLAKTDKTFKHQRALMPGGTCEATVFDAFGYTAAAVCIPLGNYHNMNHATGKIMAEYVDLTDWTNMAKLLAAACENSPSFTGDHTALRDRLDKRFKQFEKYL